MALTWRVWETAFVCNGPGRTKQWGTEATIVPRRILSFWGNQNENDMLSQNEAEWGRIERSLLINKWIRYACSLSIDTMEALIKEDRQGKHLILSQPLISQAHSGLLTLSLLFSVSLVLSNNLSFFFSLSPTLFRPPSVSLWLGDSQELKPVGHCNVLNLEWNPENRD